MTMEVKMSLPGDVAAGQIPDWMDSSFFQKALREGSKDPNLTVTECEVKEAMCKGENYISIVYRALVKEERGEKYHLIVKCLPSNEARRLIADKGKFFRKEVDIYEVVFPEYEKLYKSLDTHYPWPKHYYSVLNGDRDYLVMADLKPEGFVMRDRLQGLDRNHLELCLSALAKYQAYSIAFKLRDPELFRKKVIDLFPETMFVEDFKEIVGAYNKMAYETTASVVRSWGGERYEMLADKIVNSWDTDFETIVRSLEPIEPSAVLTHGDFWVNNMVFKYASQKEAETGCAKPLEIKLLDFQVARYSSPVTDLLYLMVTSTTAKTRKEHWDDLLEHAYLGSFWETLESLGHKDDLKEGVFTIEWLRKEMKRLQTFAFQSCVTVAPIVMAEAAEVPDMDALKEEDFTAGAESPFGEMAKGKVFQERFKALLDEFEENGYFD